MFGNLNQIMESSIINSRRDHHLEVEFNFVNLEKKYVGGVLNYSHRIGENDINLSLFEPRIKIWHTDKYGSLNHQDRFSKDISLIIQNAKFLKCTFQFIKATFVDNMHYTIPTNHDEKRKSTSAEIVVGIGYETTSCYKKLKSIKGRLDISFESADNFCLNQVLENEFSILKMPKQPEDFGIRCEDKEVKFNKAFLCKISDVFAAMIENPRTSESQQGYVIIENMKAEFMKRFKKIVCEGIVTKEDLNVELLVFADRYNIQPLVKLSKSQVEKTVTKENLIDVIKIADALNDDKLLMAAVDFVSDNKGSFENDPELLEMMKTNPQCFAKMWGLLMFRKINIDH